MPDLEFVLLNPVLGTVPEQRYLASTGIAGVESGSAVTH